MKLQKYYDREYMDWTEKKAISMKSKDLCCHCGRMAFLGDPGHVARLATIDHVIPISKGGSNHHINLVMLCEDCNKEKGDKIMPIEWYKYLNFEYQKDTQEYITNYMQAMETERTHVLTYDEYNFYIDQKYMYGYNGHKNKKNTFKVKVTMKRANWDDFNLLVNYLTSYLKKNNILDNEAIVQQNISFWLTFGSIYYIEKNHEITCMIALTIKHVADYEEYHGIDFIPYMYFFPYYSSDMSAIMIYDMIKKIPDYICKEKNLSVMPMSAVLVASDKVTAKLKLFIKSTPADINNFEEFQFVLYDDKLSSEELTKAEIKTKKFLSQFKDINDNILAYLCKYSNPEDISWMINCLISFPIIKDTELANLMNIENDEDNK